MYVVITECVTVNSPCQLPVPEKRKTLILFTTEFSGTLWNPGLHADYDI